MEKRISPQLQAQLKQWLKKFKLEEMDLTLVITAFLGDAVLDLVVAEELIKRSNAREGVLTEQRKQIVNNDFFAQIFVKLNIQPFIRAAFSYIPSVKDKANFIEAFFGAIFLVFNYAKCVEIWQKLQMIMGKKSKIKAGTYLSSEERESKVRFRQLYADLGLTPKNAKSVLQELCQKQGLEIPKYTVIEHSGPDHNPIFQVKVSGIIFADPPRRVLSAIGNGSSKKVAEIKAAENLCDQIFLEYITS
ncbi:MAG: ribonuclease III domain-containing protein [Promethearchaeota archaeon]